ncbi:surA protein [Flavobacterium saliperosum S13]|uniref:Periplasmic chaperone for outer membrane proteins SurA n=2 Tax=Flavobacterium saliperosum TaxID=329186 RepID=A0A1G4V441_9FLAO|nr:peptidylprolyl isomerase [Flavobacterium saliperosum]ESU27749.1 surA protein [Flavobacterium saliperosum S13]SCX00897.1 periplasmic chaperone for outer membrane proteins SurA [Flavobacterium saliperosum]
MKLINHKVALIFGVVICAFNTMYAQPGQKKKIDGVVAVVGDYVVLDSDIDKTFIELQAQGVEVKNISRCEMLGKLLEDKLYAHQAIQDSIVVTDGEVNEFMNSQLDQMVEQVGSVDKVIKFYNKKNLEDFKAYFFDVVKMNKLTTQMQRKIVDEVEITPEEVRTFFNAIPKEDLPVFGAEMEVAQIVVKPVISQAEKQKVIDKLKELKKEVQEGSSFFSRAVLYSEDPGSKSNGGYYKLTKKTQFVKEFKDVAFSLQEGEISDPFETEFGFHIIYLEKIRGQELDVRHILISPKVTNEALTDAKTKIETIRKRVVDGEISFAEAARQFSDEKETRNSGGILINPRTMESRFELTKMDPTLYSQVSELKDNEVSLPLVDEEQNGNKKYKLITVTNRFEEHTADFAKDYLKIKDLALKEKQIKAVAKWSEEKIKETYIKINGEYRDCAFTNNWLKK